MMSKIKFYLGFMTAEIAKKDFDPLSLLQKLLIAYSTTNIFKAKFSLSNLKHQDNAICKQLALEVDLDELLRKLDKSLIEKQLTPGSDLIDLLSVYFAFFPGKKNAFQSDLKKKLVEVNIYQPFDAMMQLYPQFLPQRRPFLEEKSEWDLGYHARETAPMPSLMLSPMIAEMKADDLPNQMHKLSALSENIKVTRSMDDLNKLQMTLGYLARDMTPEQRETFNVLPVLMMYRRLDPPLISSTYQYFDCLSLQMCAKSLTEEERTRHQVIPYLLAIFKNWEKDLYDFAFYALKEFLREGKLAPHERKDIILWLSDKNNFTGDPRLPIMLRMHDYDYRFEQHLANLVYELNYEERRFLFFLNLPSIQESARSAMKQSVTALTPGIHFGIQWEAVARHCMIIGYACKYSHQVADALYEELGSEEITQMIMRKL